MLTLYVRTGCLFCQKVLDTAEDLGIELELKNVADSKVAAELIERGGKKQEPYLVDSDNDVEMYEAPDIIAYLKERYPKD